MIKILKNRKLNKKGFVLLFAVILTSIMLSVSLGLTDITYKEIGFGTQAKNTGEAFFAADTGIECALYYDLKGAETDFGGNQNPFGYGGSDLTTMNCAGTNLIFNLDQYGVYSLNGPWYFTLPSLGFNSKSCAIVKVDKTVSGTTKIISKGYNTGGDTINCVSTDINRIEREIELQYPS